MKKNIYHKSCPECNGRGKITLAISRRARRRYLRRQAQFEQGIEGAIKPSTLACHVDMCHHCNGCGLIDAKGFPEINKKYPKIAIIGGGIGGIAFAVACLHRGIPYTLYERDESFDARTQGYGLTLQQASKAIEGLGIFGLKGGLTSTKHIVHDPSGKIIGEWGRRNVLDLGEEKPTKRRNVHISRQELRAVLLSQLFEDTNIKWGRSLKNISHNTSGQVDLEFQTGENIEKSQADLVVGADGIRSSVRGLELGEEASPLQYLGCIVILGICPLDSLNKPLNALLDSITVFQTVNGHERIYMMPYDEDTIMWQLSFPMSEEDAKILSKKGPDALKQEGIKRLGDWHEPIPEILQTTESSRITGYPVYDREVLEPEALRDFGNITLLGDAMHPMSPFKGQGANQALLDALDLARDISIKCDSDSNWRDVGLRKTILEDFEKKILERSAMKVRDSADAVDLLHSDAVLHEGDTPRTRGI